MDERLRKVAVGGKKESTKGKGKAGPFVCAVLDALGRRMPRINSDGAMTIKTVQ
jgi:hypothetical protein